MPFNSRRTDNQPHLVGISQGALEYRKVADGCWKRTHKLILTMWRRNVANRARIGGHPSNGSFRPRAELDLCVEAKSEHKTLVAVDGFSHFFWQAR